MFMLEMGRAQCGWGLSIYANETDLLKGVLTIEEVRTIQVVADIFFLF